MAQHSVHRLICLVTLLTAITAQEQTRWSRQISSYTADISDWVPLPGPVQREPPKKQALPPIKRQAVAEPRILSEPFPGFSRPTGFNQDFPPRNYYNSPANRQLYLQSVPTAPQNYLTESGFGQSIRFGLSQPNFPLNQGFVSPQFAFDNIQPGPQMPPLKPLTRPQLPLPQSPVKFDNFPKVPVNQAKPYVGQISQTPNQKLEGPKFVDGYRVENYTNNIAFNNKKKGVQSLQKIKFENYDKAPKIETIPSKPKTEREEVQLLYVPVESLNRGQFNFRNPMTSQLVNTDLYSQSLPKPNPLKQPFASELPKAPPAKPLDTFSASQDYFSNYDVLKDDQIPKYSTIASPFPTLLPTTPKPKKLKPHQPPLAIFLTQEARKGHQVKVGDVLSSLKNADTIAVLDTVNPQNAPKVFIGPSSLKPPENYVRFELPYLSNIENTDKKKLPFFVAPLSYNTPQGFAKIPFPSPHVGSVVINSLIKESSPSAPVRHSPPAANTNAYNVNHRDQKPVTQKPSFSYYSTVSPKTNAPPANAQQHYYSFEPQSVTAITQPKQPETNVLTAPPKTGSYFISNVGDQYNPQYINFPVQANLEPVRDYNKRVQAETTTTPKTTVTTTTTRPPSTYSSQLLETHNPYSINQAFHFSTPLDYHNFYDDYKDPYVTPGSNQVPKSPPTPGPATVPSSQPPKPEVVSEEQSYHQSSSPNYLQNYNPEIHYDIEAPNSRFPIYNNNDYTTRPEVSSEKYQTNSQTIVEPNNQNYYVGSNENVEYKQPQENLTETIVNKITGHPITDEIPPKQVFDQYETSHESEDHQASSSSSTTSTTTRRTPIRTRGRPKYTTTPRIESGESTTRAAITRRPLRERRPLPPRSRYEPNKITTERATRKPTESSESTTKSSRQRTRGRVQYKPSENEEFFNKKSKGSNTKDEDLAYQRDVLHQNYPVTLMERMSTVDIEAITEPTQKLSSAAEMYADTEKAYAHDSASLAYADNSASQENSQDYSTGNEAQTEATYVSKHPSTQSEEYFYQTRSSSAPIQALFEDSVEEEQQQTTPQKADRPDIISYATDTSPTESENNKTSYSNSNEYPNTREDKTQTSQDVEITKVGNQESSHETETEENIVQTTPSYNRVRVRPGVIRQYHQASTTERSRPERRKPVQAITYRPAFDRRRTTMRIEEIEADLKTKQVHSRPEVQDYKHPVYKPDPTTEPSVTTAASVDSNTKRGHFRRRRPTYTTTSTEATSTRKSNYEVKNRFRGRRPTEKPAEKPELQQTDSTTTTVRNTPYSRYSHRPRLSERYNKKTTPDVDESEDQDSNYSINRPKYVAPESDQWSPKFSSDSFKPYNPNDIQEETKSLQTEPKPENDKDGGELDIITARNDYDDILLTVTPATNNRGIKKLPDIPPTLEAYVEQSKTTKSDSPDTMSTFETMLEEVMKSLEEQDENEYTSNVMKHKGGEIGEIPPERIISSGEENTHRNTGAEADITTTTPAEEDSNLSKDQISGKGRRRGYWKKVKVRPISTEAIETAESQYYTNTVNRLGEAVGPSKQIHEKNNYDKPKISVTTYKPNFQFIKDFFDSEDEFPEDVLPTIDIPKINKQNDNLPSEAHSTKSAEVKTTLKPTSPGDQDLGTGSPDPTLMDSMYYSTPTEPTSTESVLSLLDRSDEFSFMDYLFGATANENEKHVEKKNTTESTTQAAVEITTEQAKSKVTTESTYIPEEITAVTDYNTETVTEFIDIQKMDAATVEETHSPYANIETSSESSFMNPANVVSTSMSTEVSHETEICFRGKCIKTNKDIL